MNDKVRRAIRGSKNHEKCSKNVQKVVQNHEKCGLGVEKNEVEKRRGFFSEKSHAVAATVRRNWAARPYTSTLRAASRQAPRGKYLQAGSLMTPYDHSTSCLGGTVADITSNIDLKGRSPMPPALVFCHTGDMCIVPGGCQGFGIGKWDQLRKVVCYDSQKHVFSKS